MTIQEILKGSVKTIVSNIEILAKDYKDKTGRNVCRTCPSDVNYMLLTLKNIYKMCEFRFKAERAQYKNKKGDTFTISNDVLTNENAIEFLKTNPERISLFSVYPSNWKKLIEEDQEEETKDETSIRLMAEAEEKAANGDNELLKELLLKLSLKELRAKYPEISAKRTDDFVNKVIEGLSVKEE